MQENFANTIYLIYNVTVTFQLHYYTPVPSQYYFRLCQEYFCAAAPCFFQRIIFFKTAETNSKSTYINIEQEFEELSRLL